MKAADLCIIGGGVMGTAIAWRCAIQGAHVVLLEAKAIAQGASGAAAGMFAAQAEASAPGPLFEAAVTSRTLLEQWIPQLEEESGIDVGYVTSGLLRTARGHEEAALLQQRIAWQKEAGCQVVWLEEDLLRQEEPLLFTPPSEAARWAPPVGALFCPDDRLVIAPRLVLAFARAARLLPQLAQPPFALTAVRGQILALRPAVETVPNHTLFAGPGQYLVPKGNGMLLAGSVEEAAAVLAQPTLSTIAHLA
ncbi:MAG: FAD-dependent oxidoreductase, partial [Firmicutes bacterium]|nr:FAD-dependent oxidoreductase [Bacillota bacterium]